MMTSNHSRDGVSRLLVKGDCDKLKDPKMRAPVDQVE